MKKRTYRLTLEEIKYLKNNKETSEDIAEYLGISVVLLDQILHPKEKERISHYLVMKAIKKGTLKRLPCEKCGNEKTHAHHSDYSKPLDVIWLCPKHHRELHKAIILRAEAK